MKTCLVLVLLLAACARPDASSSGPAPAKGPIVSIHIDETGTIHLEDRVVTIDELRQQLEVVQSQDGSVRYSRANPQGEPPPRAMEALQVVVDLGLPVELLEGPQ